MTNPQLYPTYRPTLMGHRHAVASSHYLATEAGMSILRQGGNVFDAGVATGLCINVLQPNLTSLGGVAPIILHSAAENRTVVIDGLGVWPQAASINYFREHHNNDLPLGVLRSVTPAAADAWLAALEMFGSLPLAQVAAPAIELAERGFPMYGALHGDLTNDPAGFAQWPATGEILLPGGRVPALGERLVQADLARTLRRLVAASERGGIQAARDLFYRGEIAQTLADFSQSQGGLMTYDDLANFQVQIEEPILTDYHGYTVASCGPWCQGPVVNQTLNILAAFDVVSMGHNSADYAHVMIEALKLVFADREEFYGDPRFVEVPLADLLSQAYARERAGLIDMDHAWPGMPPHGTPGQAASQSAPVAAKPGRIQLDTSYLCVMDADGNMFSATPSDSAKDTPMVPGLGFILSARGTQSWFDPQHASALMPGKRPRLTPNPALVFQAGRPFMAFGTPGGDAQCQAMVQMLVNLLDFGMDPQQAIEAPRLTTESFPNSFWPHVYNPNWVNVEGRIPETVRAELARRGHEVHVLPDYSRATCSLCAIQLDADKGTLLAGADPRRENYALAW